VLWAHVQEPPPSLVKAGFSKGIDEVFQKALAKAPTDRYQSGGELSSAFSKAVGVAPGTGRGRPAKRRRLRSRRSRVLAMVAAGLALVLVAVAAFAILGGGTTYIPGPNTVTRIAADSDAFAQPIHVDEQPIGIAFAGKSLWVINLIGKTLNRIDPQTGTVLNNTGTGGSPTGIAGGPDGLFLTTGFGTEGGTSQVMSVNLNTNQVQPFCAVPSGSEAIAEGSGFLWVAATNRGEVWRIAPNGCDVTKIALGNSKNPADPTVISADTNGSAGVWVGDGLTPTAYRIDPATQDHSPFGATGSPTGIAFGFGSVWISVGADDQVVRLDPKSGQTQTTIDDALKSADCNQPTGIAAGPDGIWVGCYGSDRLVLIDPKTDKIVKHLMVQGAPGAVVADPNGDVWVTVHAP